MKNNKEKLRALRQFFNLGIMQSANVLSNIINRQVSINIPEIFILSIDKAVEFLGDPDEKVVSVYMKVSNAIKTGVLLTMNEDSAKSIVKYCVKYDVSKENDYFIGVIEEISNILISSFLNTLANCIKRRILPDVPDFAVDMKGAILDSVFAEHKNENLEVLLMTADIFSEDTLKINFLLIPEDNTIEMILKEVCI